MPRGNWGPRPKGSTPPPKRKGTTTVTEAQARAAYMLMGGTRTLNGLLEALVKEFGLRAPPKSQLGRWSTKFGWVELAEAHDDRVAKRAATAVVNAHTKVNVAVARKAGEPEAVNRAWVTERLRQVVKRCMQHKLVLDETGQPTGEMVFDADVEFKPKEATRALELLGKDIGMFVERHEVGDPGTFDGLTDDEIRRELARELAAVQVADGRTAEAASAEKPSRVH